MSNTVSIAPLLAEQRKFPHDDVKALAKVCDYSYIDIASKVNSRVIGIYPTTYQIMTGEQWILSGQPNKQYSLRKVFNFSDTTLTIAHGINFTTLTNFTHIYGTFFDGTNWLALPHIAAGAPTQQITIAVNATNIVITKGAGAPTISSGLCVLEWLSQV